MSNIMTLLHYQFVQNAFIAGAAAAIVAAFVGYFVVIRGLTFAGHVMGDVGFAGAAGALVLGVAPVYGLLAFTILAAAAIAALTRRLNERSVTTGIILVLALGLGFLFVSLYRAYAEPAYSILFGSIVGINTAQVAITVSLGIVVVLVLLALFRPLLFSSYDPEAADARGVPVKFISIIFLILVAITVSISIQIIGALLIFTLLIGPPATAIRLVARPHRAIILSMALGLSYTWLGILLALVGKYPVTFYISMISFAVYLPVRLLPARFVAGERVEP